MAGSFEALYKQLFSGVLTTTVTHNQNLFGVGIIVTSESIARPDIVDYIKYTPGNERNQFTVTFTGISTGEVMVVDSDYLWTNMPAPEVVQALSGSYMEAGGDIILGTAGSTIIIPGSLQITGSGAYSGSFSGSYVGDGSGLTGIVHTSASFASTASYVNPLNQNVDITGNITASGTISGSNLTGTNTGDVTLAGSPDYITISGQTITRNTIDISDDTNLAVSDTTGQTGIDMTLTGDTVSGTVSGLTTTSNVLFNNITASANISASGDIKAYNFTSSNAFHAQAHSGFEFTISGSHFNMLAQSADKDLYFLTNTGTGSINFGTNNINSQVVIGTGGHITASGDISSSGNVLGNILRAADRVYIGPGPDGEKSSISVSGNNTDWASEEGNIIITPKPDGSLTIGNNASITASGNISASATVYGNTGSFNYLSNTNGILSGSFSGSFEGDGFGLTDVPVTVTNTLWVSPAGNDSTAIKGNLQRPWLSVSASVAAASSGDSVIMEPGTYIESPFTVGTGVTLKSLGGLKSATVSASNNSANFITQGVSTRLEGFTLVCPSGSFAGIFYDNVGTGIVHDVTLKGQGNSIGFQISQSTDVGTSKVIYNELRYGGGNFDKLAYIQGGILACDGVHVPGGGNIDKIFHMANVAPWAGGAGGGRLQAINTNAGNAGVSSSFYIEGGANVILGCNLFNVQEAFHIAGQPYTVQAMNAYIDNNVDKHITIDAGISGSDSQLNFVAAHMQAAKITATPDFIPSPHAFSFQDDDISLNPAFRIYSDLEAGHANKGFISGFGEGLPYNKGMEIWASGSGGVSQSLTVAATSRDGSTFDFAYSASGDCLYLGNTQKSPDIDDLFLFFTGLQYKQATTGSYAAPTSPSYLAEMYTTSSTWVARTGLQIISHEDGYSYANNVFSHNDSHEHAIADVKTETWATSSLFGIEARWGRIRLLQAQTVSPVFEQFIFSPNSTIINPKGQLSFRGKGLYRDTILAAGNIWGEDGKMVLDSGDFTVGTGTANEQTFTWAYEKSKLNQTDSPEAIFFSVTLPRGTCTAHPLKVRVFAMDDGGGGSTTIRVNCYPTEVEGVLVNDPAGGKIPTPRTAANTDIVTTNNAQFEDMSITAVTDKPFAVETDAGFDISSFYEGDLLFLRVAANAGEFIVLGVEVSVVKWALGDRTI